MQSNRFDDQVCLKIYPLRDARWPFDRPKGAAFFYVRGLIFSVPR